MRYFVHLYQTDNNYKHKETIREIEVSENGIDELIEKVNYLEWEETDEEDE